MSSVAKKQQTNNNAVVPLSDPVRRAELKALRGLARLAEGIFNYEGTGDVLREALQSASTDFGMLQDATALDDIPLLRSTRSPSLSRRKSRVALPPVLVGSNRKTSTSGNGRPVFPTPVRRKRRGFAIGTGPVSGTCAFTSRSARSNR